MTRNGFSTSVYWLLLLHTVHTPPVTHRRKIKVTPTSQRVFSPRFQTTLVTSRLISPPDTSCGNGWALSLLRGKSTASSAGLSPALKHRGNERRISRVESVRRSVSVFLQISETQEMLLSFYFASTINYDIS